MILPQVVLIADDLTGAADSGVTFARRGARAVVVWGDGAAPEADVLVLSTESRQLSRAAAVQRVRERTAAAIEHLDRGAQAGPWIYKKIDSTLRGHPGPELAAVMAVTGAPRALVAPAFPAQGRTTVGGRHFVHGALLTETVFGQEVTTEDVGSRMVSGVPGVALTRLGLDLVRQGADAVAEVLARCAGVVVADAEIDADLSCLAAAALRSETRLLCGSAGLAEALAASLVDTWRREASLDVSPPRCTAGSGVLVVAASRHPRTLAQIKMLQAVGMPVVSPALPALIGDTEDRAVRAVMRRAQDGLATVGTVVLTTADLPTLQGQGEALAVGLAALARRLLDAGGVGGVVLTGGDAAVAVSRAYHAAGLRLQGEVRAGIPWGYLMGGPAESLPVVTKAGGFGEDDVLLASIQFLQGVDHD